MRTRYSECRSSKDTACPLTFKANTACKPSRGAAIIVRDRIEELCKEDADITPKRILMCVYQFRYRELFADIMLVLILIELNE